VPDVETTTAGADVNHYMLGISQVLLTSRVASDAAGRGKEDECQRSIISLRR
jgi:hypothetical protein